MDDNMILILYLFVLGLLMFVAGVILLKFYKKKRSRCSEEVIGTVVSMASERGRSMTIEGQERTFHQGVYEYEVNGEMYYSPSTVQTTARPKFGKQRVLFVNPENPNEIIEKRFITYLPTGLMFLLCGIMWLITIIVAICVYA